MGVGISSNAQPPPNAELLHDEQSSDVIANPAPMPIKKNVDLISPHIAKTLGEPVVEVRDICKQFSIKGRDEVVHALAGITLAADHEFGPIRRGEFVMIRGPSGGGKTTLLNMLGTLDYPSNGSIEILGSVVNKDSSDRYLANLRLRKIGFVFQTFNLISTMSAFENVELPMIIHGTLSKAQCKQRAIELLELVGLGDRLEHLPSELSGGEQQRVTIARALSNEPEILLLDEPTGDLDTKNTIEIMDILLDINVQKRTTCIMVTHNDDLEIYADRVLYVRDGAFQKQAVNKQQTKLELHSYLAYINQQ
eukprot:CAMPEP_0202690748 /NCGR_PEP_ID=MMETSP1385-20130828/5643_1 /ASSEMBLY_ACC=CAM_ASM_000861 /TAXON_ID=933848 /ORGANISM="Elphidium margaritaceum" /LENGTH=307 /DNA_ID=CAMNT_0049346039 /DNA_START=24 /DNA_END=947 /DNA_ORIENTATION=+